MKKWIAIVALIIIVLVGYSSNRGGLTMEKFNEIQVGMTIEKVVDIIGVEGEIIAEAGDPGTVFHTVLYSYSGDKIKGSAGATANFQFIGNKLAAKVQYGLKGKSQ